MSAEESVDIAEEEGIIPNLFFSFLVSVFYQFSRSSPVFLLGIVAFFFGLCIASPLRCASFFVCRDFCIPPLTLD